ncbi:hypothetical protein PIB30_041188 [Stylosanthes scabra]|uniref:Uncharacterized protein n=1 Tax=Stylosanthes scabra TaxID=79078 RepID=A0ABU6XDL6_9FABA|nr:hypothetical protein [Stylosanthes scabra]
MATHGTVTSENTKDGFAHANIYLGDGTLSDITNVYVIPNETLVARRKRIEKLTARRKVLALPGKYVAHGPTLPPLAKSKDNCKQLQSLGLGSTTADETFNARKQRIEKLTARRKVLVLPGNSGGSALPPLAKSKENCEQDSDGGLGSTIAGN